MGKPSYDDIHLNLIESFFTTLTFNVLFPVRVHCFKSMRWWSNGSWCKRSDQPTEYTERYLNIRSNKMRESTVSDTFCTVSSLMNHATHCQWFRIAIIITKRWIFLIDRFNNWFTRWNKTLVICSTTCKLLIFIPHVPTRILEHCLFAKLHWCILLPNVRLVGYF